MSKAQQIHEASMKILAKTGMRFHHPDAIEILKKNGIRVEGEIAYFTEEQIMYWVGKAPSIVDLYADDPKYDMHIGGSSRYNGPCGGSTFIMEPDGKMRDAVMADFVKLTKLFEGNPAYHLNGGLAVQPSDIPASVAQLMLAYASMVYTSKCVFAAAGDYHVCDTFAELACIRYGLTKEQLAEKPRICTIANTNTPLLLDRVMTETILGFGKYRQPVIIASAAMAGTTSPVTLAGTIALVNAEVISAIALSQMANPGAPVIYGSQTSNADMATCAMAIGSPEGALCYRYCAEMARFYGVPSRGGGSLSDAKAFNAQAGYESMLTCMACKEGGINVMTQSAGIINSYLAVSYEKLITDFEILDFVDRYCRDIEIDDETIPLDLIDEVGHEGSYLTEDHTLEYCREELLAPKVSVRGPQQNGPAKLLENINARIDKLLAAYKAPQISPEVHAAMSAFLIKEGVGMEYIEKVLNV